PTMILKHRKVVATSLPPLSAEQAHVNPTGPLVNSLLRTNIRSFADTLVNGVLGQALEIVPYRSARLALLRACVPRQRRQFSCR
ncbi:MAG TPA: hypothetical protein VFE56_11000, partial [Candidatus Binataceae bacterium]|nr:hypothetical protein [Candidatus Binataceae bacterium]